MPLHSVAMTTVYHRPICRAASSQGARQLAERNVPSVSLSLCSIHRPWGSGCKQSRCREFIRREQYDTIVTNRSLFLLQIRGTCLYRWVGRCRAHPLQMPNFITRMETSEKHLATVRTELLSIWSLIHIRVDTQSDLTKDATLSRWSCLQYEGSKTL